MANKVDARILALLDQRAIAGLGPLRASDLVKTLQLPRSTINRRLQYLLVEGHISLTGAGPMSAYSRSVQPAAVPSVPGVGLEADRPAVSAALSPPWSNKALALRELLQAPIGTRAPVSYQAHFVTDYSPNNSSLLPIELAEELHALSRMQGHLPAGTYARKVLEQLLIDLSWYSSRLEGNRKSLLDTQSLFIRGRSIGDDMDTTMLLNHKEAIEFMVDAVPTEGITRPVVCNIQSLLMQGLLPDSDNLGAIRLRVVNIDGSVYLPSQIPSILSENLDLIVEKVRHIKNPVEAAFFLWINMAYLQAFEDGNKRTSRLCANLPLLLSNCAPLSFADVERNDYAMAMLGVYERLDTTLAIELFEWTYRKSMPKFKAVLQSMGQPDPFRLRYREQLGEAMREIVARGKTLTQVLGESSLSEGDRVAFESLLRSELAAIAPHNCARYRMSIGMTQAWVDKGRQI